ncbi:hypothetical protein A3742_03345 [Oleiphilus sp. HI0071]|nr:hypothetical protein A3737_01600 [Oleiphilus sp. HI0065]KZY89835.1 hypothetical protein A3742_03345 [Oleiphilus sp. HI0071]KZY97218.1 hypothetical protein A3744_13350 [Oleiphilus sp. HI0073]KZZ51627.1 hypothetical protein A3760_12190 [Oleiphilus sp. HI0122]KZZ54798.1 hypothetical protein A3758_00685 [Oleiphilus sp. HI0118]KZZ67254.1 hypothetical protein A3765_04640 [Oleiphilus sp. HI0130]KZZ76666.1 hypothetical protein A3767_03110 [Oleiphilus sp. HI0133]
MNLHALLAQAHTENVRVAIALEGNPEWLLSAYRTLRAHLSERHQHTLTEKALVLSNDERLLFSETNDALIQPPKFKTCLGTETSLLVWDLLAATNPDALAALSGTLAGGGVLLSLASPDAIMLPSAKRWYQIFCESPNTLVLNEKRFTQAIESLVNELPQERIQQSPPQYAESQSIHLNPGQMKCVERIEHAVTGHRNRPVVIRADRGRGKSTALGVASAMLINQDRTRNIVLVSDQRTSVEVLRKHFTQHLHNPDDHSKLKIMPSNAVIDSKLECALVLIDEAASMPLTVLESIIRRYSRVVLASTLHGYEGSGRGFDLKLHKILERCKQQPKFLTLEEPIRWASSCALEKTINDAFILNAPFDKLEPSKADDTPTTTWFRPTDLHNKEQEIRTVFSLLVLAHYQTRPSDLALLLDSPSLHIAVMQTAGGIAAAALCIDEDIPEAQDALLADDILSGKRRLKGRLLPQALASFYSDSRWLQQRSLRVMRIVVHPTQQNHGLGSALLKQVHEYAQQNTFSACTVSFGADAELLRFWQRAGYRCLRLSYKADASSGLRSAMLVNPLERKTTSLCDQHQGYFHQHLISGLAHFYKDIDPKLIAGLLTEIDTKPLHAKLDTSALNKLHRFAESKSAPWDCWPELQSLIVLSCTEPSAKENTDMTGLIRYILLGDDGVVSEEGGKKAWERHLREATKALLLLDRDSN